jgi:hypothetical protein
MGLKMLKQSAYNNYYNLILDFTLHSQLANFQHIQTATVVYYRVVYLL